MASYDPATYGEHIAEVYDTWFGACDPSAIDTLHTLAGAGPALELGVGTGRIALPLSERGIVVHGIDASPSSSGSGTSLPTAPPSASAKQHWPGCVRAGCCSA